MVTWTARSLRRTLESPATPCSVKARGRDSRWSPRPLVRIRHGDPGQPNDSWPGNWSMKSSGNREVYRVTTWIKVPGSTSPEFTQLTCPESLRDIETCLPALQPKPYHMGLRGMIARNTLADADENRDWREYADFARILIGTARKLQAGEELGVEMDSTVYALDAATIDPCLALFPWVQFRAAKAAVKLHKLRRRGSVDLSRPSPAARSKSPAGGLGGASGTAGHGSQARTRDAVPALPADADCRDLPGAGSTVPGSDPAYCF